MTCKDKLEGIMPTELSRICSRKDVNEDSLSLAKTIGVLSSDLR